MRILGMEIRRSAEERAQTLSQASPDLLSLFGLDTLKAASDVVVTVDSALGVPAIFGAVNFIASSIAALPLNAFERKRDGSVQKLKAGPLVTILHDAVNPGLTSFDWRKSLMEQCLTGGRGLTFIERNGAGEVMNLWPLDPTRVTISARNGVRSYEYKDTDGKTKAYQASEIIDLAFMLKSDGLSHRSPIFANRDTVGLAIAATQFASKFFQNGGVPPFAIEGTFQSGAAMGRAMDDLESAVRKASKERRQALALPQGLKITPIGLDAKKSHLLELKAFLVEEVARIYSLPPTFLQDLSHGTYSNTEQQDLHFVKHTLKRWVEALEQELNLKMFGRDNRRRYVKLNVDGLLRGDFKTRMEGTAQAIQTGQMTPNEARALEERDALAGGDRLFMQGAMLPIEDIGADDDDTAGGAGDGM